MFIKVTYFTIFDSFIEETYPLKSIRVHMINLEEL